MDFWQEQKVVSEFVEYQRYVVWRSLPVPESSLVSVPAAASCLLPPPLLHPTGWWQVHGSFDESFVSQMEETVVLSLSLLGRVEAAPEVFVLLGQSPASFQPQPQPQMFSFLAAAAAVVSGQEVETEEVQEVAFS